MCLLLHQPKGLTLSKSDIADYVDHNPDGFGAARGDGAKLHWVRMVGSAAEIDATYRRHFAGRECVLHFRLATHGAKDEANAHPFPVVPGLVVAHNGILDCGNDLRPEFSDTWHLVEHLLRPLALTPDGINHLLSDEFAHVMGKMIGSSNKLALVHASGRVSIINRDAGVEHRGAWYSNTYAWTNRYGYSSSAYSGYGRRGTWRKDPATGNWHQSWSDDDDRAWWEESFGPDANACGADADATADPPPVTGAAATLARLRADADGAANFVAYLAIVLGKLTPDQRWAEMLRLCRNQPSLTAEVLGEWYSVKAADVRAALSDDDGGASWVVETMLEVVEEVEGWPEDATGDESGAATLAAELRGTLALPPGAA